MSDPQNTATGTGAGLSSGRRLVWGVWAVVVAVVAWRLLMPTGAAVGPVDALPASTGIAWDARFVNPAPAEGDLMLPMPCGAAMAFRRVDTPTGPNPLDDRPVTLGGTNPETDYAEYLRKDAVAGPFRGDTEGSHYYWLGKYEVTQDQYQSLFSGACPTPSIGGRRPVMAVSWFDAQRFAQRYSQWLLREAKGTLPARGTARAFVRLPTEAEWEYAARGGAAVSDVEFSAPLFPMPEGTLRYAWVGGTRSANGQVRPVGALLPNPLGLHDMLGNAAEMVLEPYRLNRAGRLHGQAGGIIVKGGDYETPEARLRSAMRLELAPYDEATGDANALKTAGFRVVLALPAVTDLQEAAALPKAFQALRAELDDEPEQPQPSLRLALRMGATLIQAVREDQAQLTALQKFHEDWRQRRKAEAGADAGIGDLRKMIEGVRQSRDVSFKAYMDLLDLTARWDDAQISRQLIALAAEPGGRDHDRMLELARLFAAQAQAYRRGPRQRPSEMLLVIAK